MKKLKSATTQKRPKIGFQDRLWLNADQKYCRMLQGEHSAILSTFIKLPFVFKIFVLSIFEWLLKAGFTVVLLLCIFETSVHVYVYLTCLFTLSGFILSKSCKTSITRPLTYEMVFTASPALYSRLLDSDRTVCK